ncbi:MAG: type IX secretion system outer membrane channel protein PorV [Bacteroidales bacterium]
MTKIDLMLKGLKAVTLALSFVFVLLVSAPATGQITTGQVAGSNVLNAIQTSVPFLGIAPDSRAGAMGDVGVASTPDVNSMHWNVGKYGFIPSNGGFAISYTPWLRNLIPDINLAYLTGFYRVDNRSVVAGSLRYFSLGSIIFTNITGNVVGEYNPNEFALDAGYSRMLTDNFSMGMAFRFTRSDLTSGQNTSDGQETHPGISFAADLGMYYQKAVNVGTSDGEWAAGLSLTNMGTPVSYTLDATKTPIPTNMKLGGRFTYNVDEYNSLSFHTDLNKLLVPSPPVLDEDTVTGDEYVLRGREAPGSVVLGMVQSFYDAPGVEMADGSYSVFREEIHEIAFSMGVEYWYREQFAIRSGYFHEHNTKGNRKYFTVGVGLQLNVFALDFSYLIPTNGINSPLANTLRFTLAFDFASLEL